MILRSLYLSLESFADDSKLLIPQSYVWMIAECQERSSFVNECREHWSFSLYISTLYCLIGVVPERFEGTTIPPVNGYSLSFTIELCQITMTLQVHCKTCTYLNLPVYVPQTVSTSPSQTDTVNTQATTFLYHHSLHCRAAAEVDSSPLDLYRRGW